MALTQHRVHEVAADILACVCDALNEAAAADPEWMLPGCPAFACVVPGQPAWDHCIDSACGDGEPGQLTVHVVGLRPVTVDRDGRASTALAQMTTRGCAPPPATLVDLVVTLLRCAPTVDEGGCPPPCEQQAAAARVLHADAVTVWQALTCCLPEISHTRRTPLWSMPSGPQVLGPQGGCVGIEQRITITLPAVCCPGDAS